MLVLPTDWSPKKTSLYFAKGDTDAIFFVYNIDLKSLSFFFQMKMKMKRREREKKKMKWSENEFSLNPLFYMRARKNRQLWRATLNLFIHLFYPHFLLYYIYALDAIIVIKLILMGLSDQ